MNLYLLATDSILVPSMKMCSSDMTPSVCRNEILHVWFGDGDDIENEDAVQHPRI